MSYPKTVEARLLELYDLSLSDLARIFEECDRDKDKYKKRLEEIETALAASVMAQISSDKFLLH